MIDEIVYRVYVIGCGVLTVGIVAAMGFMQ